MKSIIRKQLIIILLLMLAIPFTAVSGNNASEATGIQFFNGTWNDAMKEAQKHNKIIFVDAYAVWCGPCKWMDANVFPQEEVGNFYNGKFINYKFDMEKGEGPGFARQYRVTAFPTFLFIDSQGNIVHRTMGAKPPNVLIEEGRKALQISEASR